MLRRLLIVAFHFPPLAASSGIQRALSLVKYLPPCGWQPIVLTAHPRAYERTSPELLSEISDAVHVERAFALDTARHLSLFGRYLACMARPDRWVSWSWAAVPAGLRLIRRFAPAAIWSTYPIATAHLIGAELQRRSGLPWIADFRDPMAQDGYPAVPKTWRAFSAIEQRAARAAVRLVFASPSARRTYSARYARTPGERFVVIENGYDEEIFARVERQIGRPAPLNRGCLTLLHSGIVYPSERDPTALFRALGDLRRQGVIAAENFRLRFRAPVHEQLLRSLAQETATDDLVEILPPIPYADALAEMMRADGLLVMQAANCNEQIPAKFYEYLRARRPVLGLADPEGDTARAMRDAGVTHLAKLEDEAEVKRALAAFLAALADGSASPPNDGAVRAASREARVQALARILDEVCGGGTR